MDTNSNNIAQDIINFDLLGNTFELVDTNNEEESSIFIPQTVLDLLGSNGVSDCQENDSDYKEFKVESRSNNQCFQEVIEQHLDDLADQINAKSTHWQTNWAVRVFRGNFKQISFINS